MMIHKVGASGVHKSATWRVYIEEATRISYLHKARPRCNVQSVKSIIIPIFIQMGEVVSNMCFYKVQYIIQQCNYW